ncbi:hypothetical protein PsYK624_001620 [Phanerochaete sordida]|uniref:Uncharacterized protein n=1 Tax=Phanerochaete sordida TaxID=48140 RepID=A0A9P3L7X2_9APHY|nr:hypothetical protein PsYK624_001620 [Phanerochaete sordida]
MVAASSEQHRCSAQIAASNATAKSSPPDMRCPASRGASNHIPIPRSRLVNIESRPAPLQLSHSKDQCPCAGQVSPRLSSCDTHTSNLRLHFRGYTSLDDQGRPPVRKPQPMCSAVVTSNGTPRPTLPSSQIRPPLNHAVPPLALATLFTSHTPPLRTSSRIVLKFRTARTLSSRLGTPPPQARPPIRALHRTPRTRTARGRDRGTATGAARPSGEVTLVCATAGAVQPSQAAHRSSLCAPAEPRAARPAYLRARRGA